MVYKKRRLFWHFLMPGAVLFVLMVTPPVASGQEKKGAPDNGKKLEKFISANECGCAIRCIIGSGLDHRTVMPILVRHSRHFRES